MARPKEEQPTAGELEVLKVLWDRGPSTVREVMDEWKESKWRRRQWFGIEDAADVIQEPELREIISCFAAAI